MLAESTRTNAKDGAIAATIKKLADMQPLDGRKGSAAPAAVDENGGQAETAEEIEPLLKENPRRFVMFPIEFYDVWTAYKDAEANFWSAEEIELYEDGERWLGKLDGRARTLLAYALRTLATADTVVGASGLERMSDEVQVPEARCFYGFQIMQRNIHFELLHVMLEALQEGAPDAAASTAAVGALPALASRRKWVEKHLVDSRAPFRTRLVALAVSELVLSSSVFALLFHIEKKRLLASMAAPASPVARSRAAAGPGGAAGESGPSFELAVLPGVAHGVHKIWTDMHTYSDFNVILHRGLLQPADMESVRELVEEAVAVECDLADDLLALVGGSEPVELAGAPVAADSLKQHVRSVGNQVLRSFGLGDVFSDESPFAGWLSRLAPASKFPAASTPSRDRDARAATHSPASAARSVRGGAPSPLATAPLAASLSSPLKSPSKGSMAFTLEEDF